MNYSFALTGLALALCAVPAMAQDEGEDEFSSLSLEAEDVLTCKVDPQAFNTFAMMSDDEAEGFKARGWQRIKSDNPLLYLYHLPEPITIAGYKTSTVALSAGAFLAVLDEVDTKKVAAEAGISSEDAISFPGVYKGHKQVDRKEEDDPELGKIIYTRHLSISNVSTLPAKTLYGCAYRVRFVQLEPEE